MLELDRYDVTAELGRGGFGVVYLGRHRLLDRPVALKVLGVTAAADPAALAQFRLEALALAALDHPGVVRVYELVESAGELVLVMEYVPGPTLRAAIPGLALPSRLLAIEQLSDALTFTAARGIVHRDVKPDNVLISPEGRCKLVDFGIASMRTAAASGPGELGGVVGTPAYLSPEVALGGADVGSAADLYSLGVVAFELLVGQLPFTPPGGVPMLLYAHAYEPPPQPSALRPGFPVGVAAVLLQALAKDPSARPASAQEFARALTQAADRAWPGWRREADLAGAAWGDGGDPNATILEGARRPAIPPGPGPAPAAPRRDRPPRRLARATAAILAAVAAGTLASLLLSRHHQPAPTPMPAPPPPVALRLGAVTVAVNPGSGTGHCPQATFVFTGSITTSGGSGTLSYRWTYPDGAKGDAHQVAVPGGTHSVVETLRFTYTGRASATGRVQLAVAGAAPSAPVTVHYTCP
ncbi:MAG: serine/threonine-protein kinase [Mycobacteriales bacterium]